MNEDTIYTVAESESWNKAKIDFAWFKSAIAGHPWIDVPTYNKPDPVSSKGRGKAKGSNKSKQNKKGKKHVR